ncbi:hypothetical protein LJ707_01130 [Mucilaginibacter sp. UR6-1]|uniref:hypothetical protein n=1 Tax=Mucilaginibacter sp. UR6-1 TaxID=1435643 RepID=UPI001E5492DE|nr:hypothetical protein [Mucilaginibacter sp. UR6-1]MCC8407513.1 hypothetical protein [Mucilaginibacter sp. UR6-1]
MLKKLMLVLGLCPLLLNAQTPVTFSGFNKSGSAKAVVNNNILTVSWPVGSNENGQLLLDLDQGKPLFKSMQISKNKVYKAVATNLNPAFVLTVGKRDLVSQNGWNIFFDKVPQKPHQSYPVKFEKGRVNISTAGSRTVVKVGKVTAEKFNGTLEITLFNGSPLVNIAAVMSTPVDSTAILYDAGLVSQTPSWKNLAWASTDGQLQTAVANIGEASRNLAVKYRTILAQQNSGSLAVFPAPHQYFYPLDEAFNLKFVWYGNNYRDMLHGYGLGIRQELEGDKRFVPWFNAPPNTQQRLNFFCLLSAGSPGDALAEVKKFTHNDVYPKVAGYKTLSSHFHNEFIMSVVRNGKPVPDSPNFVKVFKNTGIDIIHLAEFHYTAHPKGPDSLRLPELKALHDICARFSNNKFLLLPGEEPNEFLGGHWLSFFPKPVYWVMSRKPDQPFVSEVAGYGKVYHIGDKEDMLKLMEAENGLMWTAHPRTKGSTGYPDKYKDEKFFQSDHFMGGAWKHIPADLSKPRFGDRVFELLDDMNNWGLKKHIIAEADLFTVEPENEMYAHLNVNYLKMDKLPDYKQGWQPVLNAIKGGHFFTSTGEIMLPVFNVNGKQSGETLKLPANGKATVNAQINWTFPLSFAEIISGDGKKVYRHRIELNSTQAFGSKQFSWPVDLKGRKWVRFEVWDAAVNGAFTQTIYLQ